MQYVLLIIYVICSYFFSSNINFILSSRLILTLKQVSYNNFLTHLQLTKLFCKRWIVTIVQLHVLNKYDLYKSPSLIKFNKFMKKRFFRTLLKSRSINSSIFPRRGKFRFENKGGERKKKESKKILAHVAELSAKSLREDSCKGPETRRFSSWEEERERETRGGENVN